MTQPFIIFGLPRSRTAWLAQFLSYGGKFNVGHDTAVECGSLADFFAPFENGLDGTVETGAMLGWRVIRHAMPKAKMIVVRRAVDQVAESLQRHGVPVVEGELDRRAAMLDELSAAPGVETVSYDDLGSSNGACETACGVMRECLGFADAVWWRDMHSKNVQIDLAARVHRLRANASRIEALKTEVAEYDRRIQRGDAVELILVGLERWENFWPECDGLARPHFAEVSGTSDPNRPYKLDTALMQQCAESGALKIIAARVNGRLVGYCTWMVQPDVESHGLLIAQQGGWYVMPDFSHLRLGMRMMFKSMALLKAWGVKNLFLHHRLEGRGADNVERSDHPLGKFFERLGAVEIQHTYSLWIGD